MLCIWAEVFIKKKRITNQIFKVYQKSKFWIQTQIQFFYLEGMQFLHYCGMSRFSQPNSKDQFMCCGHAYENLIDVSMFDVQNWSGSVAGEDASLFLGGRACFAWRPTVSVSGVQQLKADSITGPVWCSIQPAQHGEQDIIIKSHRSWHSCF